MWVVPIVLQHRARTGTLQLVRRKSQPKQKKLWPNNTVTHALQGKQTDGVLLDSLTSKLFFFFFENKITTLRERRKSVYHVSFFLFSYILSRGLRLLVVLSCEIFLGFYFLQLFSHSTLSAATSEKGKTTTTGRRVKWIKVYIHRKSRSAGITQCSRAHTHCCCYTDTPQHATYTNNTGT